MEPRRRSLEPFRSREELNRAVRAVLAERRQARAAAALPRPAGIGAFDPRCILTDVSNAHVTIQCDSPTVDVQASYAVSVAESITNVQHDGVDEGGIVKRMGDLLVVLRRGRLFTLRVGATLEAVARADVSLPRPHEDAWPAWYDELLIWDRTAAVVGYSYTHGATEIALFHVDAAGGLTRRATYHLKSDDYYSRSNYASRLIGSRLVFNTTRDLPDDADTNGWLPTLRRWRGDAAGTFDAIARIDRIFQPAGPLGLYPSVHSMIACDLAAVVFSCDATVVLGDSREEVYVSPTATYAWTGGRYESEGTARLYRIPFDGGAVTSLRVAGHPPDQLAFLESPDRHLNVVVERDEGSIYLLRVPLDAFADGSTEAPATAYRALNHVLVSPASVRFVGEHVLVGEKGWYRSEDDDPEARWLAVTEWRGGPVTTLNLAHRADRIEAMGGHAVVVGSRKDALGMTTIRLGAYPRVAGSFARPDSQESESRSHAFFYRPDGAEAGVFGLPIVGKDSTDGHDAEAHVVFVRNRRLALAEAGALSGVTVTDDNCEVSCVDWYGDSRPVFWGQRVFALLGYELVEGRMSGDTISEMRRLDFTPRSN